MREDPTVRSSAQGAFQPDRDSRSFQRGVSFSGNERDHLYLNVNGEQFYDLVGVSGLDDPGDGRSFAILDYDRDGWQDIAVVSANAPLFQLHRNQLGDAASDASAAQVVAVRFVGGNHAARPSTEKSNRDGYGSIVSVDLGDRTIQREQRCGEGFSAQNSATMLVGIGKRQRVESIRIRWPSGKIQEVHDVAAGTLLTAYEDPAHSPTGEPFVLQPYETPAVARRTPTDVPPVARQRLDLAMDDSSTARLRVYTTMATWCESCIGELPHLQRLRSVFDREVVGLYGVPVDPADGPEALDAYLAYHKPAYQLLSALPPDQIESVRQWVLEELRLEALPATIVTDASGSILRTTWGVPSVSELRKLLAELPR